MKTISTVNTAIIAKAAGEAGIRADEKYSVSFISREGSLLSFIIETEWSRTTCFADAETGMILGILTEARELSELMAEARTSMKVRPSLRAAAGKAA